MEVEAKFRVPNRRTHRELSELHDLAGYVLAPIGRVEVADHYYDTPDRKLLDARYSCRLRSDGDGVLVTLKGLGTAQDAVHRRDEQEVRLADLATDPNTWPESPARELALKLTDGEPLEPLLQLEQSRAKYHLLDDQHPIAEVSLDKVRSHSGKRPKNYYELELELLSDDGEDQLASVVQVLQDEYGLEPEPLSKFERALAMLKKDGGKKPAPDEVAPVAPEVLAKSEAKEPSPLLPDDSMSEAGRKIMFVHFSKMLANETGTREGADNEFLHDMRVSTRRMRAGFRIFEAFYEAKAVARFNKDLRRVAGTLGVVRDLDVLIEKAEAYEAELPPHDLLDLRVTAEPLLDTWRAQRDDARQALVEYLDGKSYRKFVESFSTFLLTPGADARPIPDGEPVAHQVCHVVPRLVMKRYEQVRAYEPVIADAPVTTYHRLRIDCKRLRYALEFFQELLGPEAPPLIKQVTDMQDLLGAMQDAHTAEGLIATFLAERVRGKKRIYPCELPGVEAYLRVQQQVQRDLLAKFAEPWAGLVGLDFRRSLGLALAAL